MEWVGFGRSPERAPKREKKTGKFYGYRDRTNDSDETSDEDEDEDEYEEEGGEAVKNFFQENINKKDIVAEDIEKFFQQRISYEDMSSGARRMLATRVACVSPATAAPEKVVFQNIAVASSVSADGNSSALESNQTSLLNGPSGAYITGSGATSAIRISGRVFQERTDKDFRLSMLVAPPPLEVLVRTELAADLRGVEENFSEEVAERRRTAKAENLVENILGLEVFSFLDQIAAACDTAEKKPVPWVKNRTDLNPRWLEFTPEKSEWQKCQDFERHKGHFPQYSFSHAFLRCVVAADNIQNPADERLAQSGYPQPDDTTETLSGIVQKIDATIDLRVSEAVYSRAKRRALADRLPETLSKFVHVHLLTVLRESELDIWNACGGSQTRLPENTWFCRPFETPGEKIKKKKRSVRTLQELVEAFKKSDGCERLNPNLPEYFFDGQTFLSQLQQPGVLPDDLDKKYEADNVFWEWRVRAEDVKDKTEVSVVDVLMLGGYGNSRMLKATTGGTRMSLRVQEAADLLLARAAQTGLINVKHPKDFMSYLLFSNTMTGRALPVSVHLTDKRVEDDEFALVQTCFKKGKEKLLSLYCESKKCAAGGAESLILRDPEYRSAFIKLCEVNRQLRDMRVGIVNDRRQKIVDLHREKREILHFFQTKNGTPRFINPNYVTASIGRR